MAGSYEIIDYRIRPAKSVERKMMCEAFRRLTPFGAIQDYRYVGLGSTYFSDFLLIHRSLGISNMISIEEDAHNGDRFDFNKPYDCITLDLRPTHEVLPTLSWEARTIIWLDYDGPLNSAILQDVATVTTNLKEGSVFIVSVNAEPKERAPKGDEEAVNGAESATPHMPGASPAVSQPKLDRLRSLIGLEKIPIDVDEKGLAGWGTSRAYHRIITREIVDTLSARNGLRHPGAHLQFHQLFNFIYNDGARMLTVGGLIHDRGQVGLVASCLFSDLPFIRDGADPCQIRVPKLTLREVRELDRMLPVADAKELVLKGVPPKDIASYAGLYRYFPIFSESDL